MLFVLLAGTYIPLEAMDRSDSSPLGRKFTERQLDVLRLIVKGLANKQIAEDTVKQHARASYAVLGVSSRTQAMTPLLRAMGFGVTRRGPRLRGDDGGALEDQHSEQDAED